MGKMPRLTGKNMVRFLEKQGFSLRRIKGSHHVMRKGEVQTVVPAHGNENLKTGTLRGILRDIGMEPEDFERLCHE